jgi:hypothetical protein
MSRDDTRVKICIVIYLNESQNCQFDDDCLQPLTSWGLLILVLKGVRPMQVSYSSGLQGASCALGFDKKRTSLSWYVWYGDTYRVLYIHIHIVYVSTYD